jgi:uncharacterized protein (DUF111 family)
VTSTPGSHPGVGTLAEIVCNIDDMTPEELSFACERILAGKALDAYVVPGTMKKGRSAHELKALCDPADADEVAADVLRETTTNGLRIIVSEKRSLSPHIETVETEWGPMRVKVSEGFGVCHVKPEHDDVARVAAAQKLPVREVAEAMLRVFQGQ